MGNGIGLYVEIRNANAYPGESIFGTVYVCVRRPIQAASLVLVFKGKQTVKKNGLIYPELDLGSFGNTLCDWGDLQSGDFAVPFRLVMPAHLPANCRVTIPSMFIQYTVTASVLSHQETIETFQVPVNIKQLVNHVPIKPNQIGPKEYKYCGCFSCSSFTFSARIDPRSFTLNEIVLITLEFDNPGRPLCLMSIDVMLSSRVDFMNPRPYRGGPLVTCPQVRTWVKLNRGKTTVPIEYPLAQDQSWFDMSLDIDYSLEYYFVIMLSRFPCYYRRYKLDVSLHPPDVDMDLPPPPPAPADWSPVHLSRVRVSSQSSPQPINRTVPEDQEIIINE